MKLTYIYLPLQLTCFSHQKVSCGSDHSLALTLTGSVFAWGDNSSGQLANPPPGGQKICSAPIEIPLPTGETARDIAAYENR